MIENPMYLKRHLQPEEYQPIKRCKTCGEAVSVGEGLKYDGEIFCGSACLVDDLRKDGYVDDY